MESTEPEARACLRCKYKIHPQGGVLPRVCPNCGAPTLSQVALDALKRINGLYRAGALNDAQFAAAQRTIIEGSD